MDNFKFSNRSRDRRDSGKLTMHNAVCDECGKDCQVPFKPSGDKPIYCSDCFEKKGGRNGGRDSNRPRDRRDSGRSPQSNINDRSTQKLVEKIGILNTKLDAIIDLLSSAEKKNIKSKPKKIAKKK